MIKTREIINFLPLIYNSVNIGLRFLLLTVSPMILSKTINIFRFYLHFILKYFYKYHPHHLNIQ